MNYFKDCHTVAEIKKRYRKLAMEHHPDRGGDTATMQEINAAYHAALAKKHETAEAGSDGREHTYYYNEDHEQAIIEKIDELIAQNLTGCDIWLIGKWVWIVGETKPHKEALKEAGCKWHAKRKCWYWKPTAGRHRYAKNSSLSDLAYTYGAKRFGDREKSGERSQRARRPALAA